jgi:hypothetical protein
VFSRDSLQHVPLHATYQFLNNVKASGAKYLLVGSYLGARCCVVLCGAAVRRCCAALLCGAAVWRSCVGHLFVPAAPPRVPSPH